MIVQLLVASIGLFGIVSAGVITVRVVRDRKAANRRTYLRERVTVLAILAVLLLVAAVAMAVGDEQIGATPLLLMNAGLALQGLMIVVCEFVNRRSRLARASRSDAEPDAGGIQEA